jgi:hypothetical protein
MSVNIFGSSGKSSNSVNKRYVDHKFTTLSTNLALKVDKAGDTLMGDLKISMNDAAIRTFGVADISSAQSVSLLVGDTFNQIRYNFGNPLKIGALYGTKFTCPKGEICRMGAFNDARAEFFQNISMNNNSITDLHHPIDNADAATKLYVDARCVKNSVGYIPNLLSNTRDKTGFIVSASSEISEATEACNVFNATGQDWLSADKENFWIQIICPERVRVHKFALKGVQSSTINNWKLQATGSNGTEWHDLFYGENVVIDQTLNFFYINPPIKYSTYRIWINNAVGALPGLSYWQLYTVDELI